MPRSSARVFHGEAVGEEAGLGRGQGVRGVGALRGDLQVRLGGLRVVAAAPGEHQGRDGGEDDEPVAARVHGWLRWSGATEDSMLDSRVSANRENVPPTSASRRSAGVLAVRLPVRVRAAVTMACASRRACRRISSASSSACAVSSSRRRAASFSMASRCRRWATSAARIRTPRRLGDLLERQAQVGDVLLGPHRRLGQRRLPARVVLAVLAVGPGERVGVGVGVLVELLVVGLVEVIEDRSEVVERVQARRGSSSSSRSRCGLVGAVLDVRLGGVGRLVDGFRGHGGRGLLRRLDRLGLRDRRGLRDLLGRLGLLDRRRLGGFAVGGLLAHQPRVEVDAADEGLTAGQDVGEGRGRGDLVVVDHWTGPPRLPPDGGAGVLVESSEESESPESAASSRW